MGHMELTSLNKEQAMVAAVLEGMETHSCIHLACHAYQNRGDATKSAPQLHDGNLALSTIMRQYFKHAEFAFLSACRTATGDDRLPDEAVHLAAGMLFAGYRTVIGTMWLIGDSYAPLVAEQVYYPIVDSETMTADSRKAASAEGGRVAFETWVPFIHLGM